MLYDRLTQPELLGRLAETEAKLADIEFQRGLLDRIEVIAQEHREEIQRALGCFVLADRRKDATT